MSEEANEKLSQEKTEEVTLNSEFAINFSGKDSPSELFCQEQGITSIGDLAEVTSLRKLDISFNPLSSLDNIQKLNQLRHLSAYCCRVTDIECLSGIKRIETLFLQQNGITSIPYGNSFNKLRELRLDRNQIANVTTLSGCSNLRILNLSWNKLTSLEGLAGLQNLQEINVSHNSLENLKHLRALPSLVELDVSSNGLRDLNGLQLLPTIEVLRAENNVIATISIPKTYFSHLNKELDKKGGGSVSSAKTTASASVAESTRTGASSKQKSTIQPSHSSKTMGTAQSSRKGSKADSTSAATASTHTSDKTVVGLQNLSELFLSGNKIKTLKGLESYGVNLDTVDLSDNEICDTEGFVLSRMSNLKKLSDMKISGNRIPPGTMGESESSSSLTTAGTTENASEIAKPLTFEESLAVCCPELREIDGRVVKRNKGKKGRRGSKGEEGGFYTWDNGSVSVIDPSDVTDMGEDSKIGEEGDEEALSDDEEFLRQAEAEAAEEYKKKNPRLVIETMLTREEVVEKETIFRGLLDHTKERIVQAVRSFVPPELQESGFDLDVGDARKSESASKKKKPPRPAAEKPLSRQGSAKTRVKNPVLDDHESFEKGRDENTAQNRSRPGSGKDSRPDSAISRASKLRSAVGSTSRENLSSTESSTGAIPRIRIGATHVEATKNKSLPAGRPPAGFDSRIKREALLDPSDDVRSQSARLADEGNAKNAHDEREKPNSARLDSDASRRKQAALTERSSSFSFGEHGSGSSNAATVRALNASAHARSTASLEQESKSPTHQHSPSGRAENGEHELMLDPTDGDNQSIQWAPLSSMEMSASAPGEYVAEHYAAALQEGLKTMESLNSGMEWREMILNEDVKDWDEQSINELQELYSPRYDRVSEASRVPPPKSREKGKALKSFRVPGLENAPQQDACADEEEK